MLAGERTASRRSSATRAFSAGHARAFRRALRLQRLIPALPPRVLTALLRALGRQRDRRSRLRLVPRRRPSSADRGVSAVGAAQNPAPWTSVFDERGLVPVVVQDWRTGEVLTLAYMNARGARAHARDRRAAPVEPLARRAVAQGRDLRQHPGGPRAAPATATATRVLALVEPAGPACHTGERTCFHSGELEPPAPHEALPALERTLADRAGAAPRGLLHRRSCSTTRRCIGEKVMEEAEEVARAAREESDERVDEEAADVLYHLAVLLRGRGRSLADAEEVLDGRRR